MAVDIFVDRGGGGPSEGAFWYGAITNKIFFKMKNAYRTQPKGTKIMDMYYHNIAFEPRMVVATEARLEAIYKAAKAGLKGDALAMAAGLLPVELRKLQQFDPTAEFAELKGRADSELEAASVIDSAIAHGDAKMALEKLKHQHGWVAKQQINIDVEQKISITQALEQANQRVLEVVDAEYTVLTDGTKDTDSANTAI